MNNLTQAKEIPLYNSNGELIKGFKGIVDANNEETVYHCPTDAYKILQHDKVYDVSIESAKKLGLNYKLNTTELKKGGRLNLNFTLPDVKFDATNTGDLVSMQIDIDNSYNGSTGLRVVVGGLRLVCLNGMTAIDKLATYYHKHTENITTKYIMQTMESGINYFNDQFKRQVQQMVFSSITPGYALNVIENWIENKVIAVKYLEIMKDIIEAGGNTDIEKSGEIRNKWMFYNVITEVLTHHIESIDTKRRYSHILTNRLRSL